MMRIGFSLSTGSIAVQRKRFILNEGFGGSALGAQWTRTHTGSGTTTTSVVAGGVWTISAGAAPVGNNRWVRLLKGVQADGVTVYRYTIVYNSAQVANGAMIYITKDATGSTLAANTIISENLGGSGVQTKTNTFTIPVGSPAPSLLISATDQAGRSIAITSIRIEAV